MSGYTKSLTYCKRKPNRNDVFGYVNQYYSPNFGCLALGRGEGKGKVRRISDWFSCREEFHDEFGTKEKIRYILFYDGRGKRIADFMREAEKRLSVSPRSKINGFKNARNVICIEFSKWWIANLARKQFLTILLRCAEEYQGKFEDALYGTAYTEATEEAVKKFFKGYTHSTTGSRYMSGYNGWVEHFKYGRNTHLLKKPPKSRTKNSK